MLVLSKQWSSGRELRGLKTNLIMLANNGHGEHRSSRNAGHGVHWGREAGHLDPSRLGGEEVARGVRSVSSGLTEAQMFKMFSSGAGSSTQARKTLYQRDGEF